MKKCLIVDTNLSSEPIYKFLKNNGFEVYVVGANKEDYLAKIVKNHININYNNVDDLYKVCQKYKIDYIIPGCNDVSYEVCSELKTKYKVGVGCDDGSIFDKINNKKKFRDLANKIGLSSPKICHSLNEVDDLKSSKLIIKPAVGFSGKGIVTVNKDNKEKLKAAVINAEGMSKDKKFIIEEFVEGQLFSFSCFLKDKKVFDYFIVQEDCTENKYAVDLSKISYDLSIDVIKKIKNEIEIFSEYLSLEDGLFHLQFICDYEQFWWVEPTRRCPGDLYSKLIDDSFNCSSNYIRNYIAPFIEIDMVKASKNDRKYVVRKTLTNKYEYKLNKINIPTNGVSSLDIYQLAKVGDSLKGAPEGRSAIYFLNFENEIEFNQSYEEFKLNERSILENGI